MFARHGDPTSIAARTGHGLWVGGGIPNRSPGGLTEAAARWNGSSWHVEPVPAVSSRADCVLRRIVPDRAGLLALGECFSDANPGHPWSRLWTLSAGRDQAGLPRPGSRPAGETGDVGGRLRRKGRRYRAVRTNPR
jgi:hypothetical protein